uniref:uncharacterized protein LOC120345124 isoform X1 n=1 Tax=Styela clava TaxID=7725 RepID=UPI00193A1ACF|nr:uncharacterized protein LOC120345124 isoform X1 [Styela clava]
MGCGSSQAVKVGSHSGLENSSSNGWTKGNLMKDFDSDEVFREADVISTNSTEIIGRRTWSCDSDSDKNGYNTTSSLQKSSGKNGTPASNANNTATNKNNVQSPELYRTQSPGKTPGNMDLKERIDILSQRRRSLQFEIGRDSNTSDNFDYLHANGNGSPMLQGSSKPPAQEFPKRRSIFPPPPDRSENPSPFGTRARYRLTLTDSQKEFFKMLDEKIAQGKDYYSEDEKSISSLVSRSGSGRLTRILASLRPQHAR